MPHAQRVLIPVQRLFDRMRQPRSRADEVADVRTRLVTAKREHARSGTAVEREATRALARELADRRRELANAVGAVRSCSGCARGRPLPQGRWDGGQCCSARTTEVFTDDEVAALALAGTTPSRLVAPSGDHAGCAFRGEKGCSLDVVDRPTLCVRYICRELEGELAKRGDLPAIKRIARELGAAFTKLASQRVEPPSRS